MDYSFFHLQVLIVDIFVRWTLFPIAILCWIVSSWSTFLFHIVEYLNTRNWRYFIHYETKSTWWIWRKSAGNMWIHFKVSYIIIAIMLSRCANILTFIWNLYTYNILFFNQSIDYWPPGGLEVYFQWTKALKKMAFNRHFFDFQGKLNMRYVTWHMFLDFLFIIL